MNISLLLRGIADITDDVVADIIADVSDDVAYFERDYCPWSRSDVVSEQQPAESREQETEITNNNEKYEQIQVLGPGLFLGLGSGLVVGLELGSGVGLGLEGRFWGQFQVQVWVWVNILFFKCIFGGWGGCFLGWIKCVGVSFRVFFSGFFFNFFWGDFLRVPVLPRDFDINKKRHTIQNSENQKGGADHLPHWLIFQKHNF